MTVTRFPLDFDALKKGDLISQHQLETVFGFRYSDEPRRFELERMQLGSEIERHTGIVPGYPGNELKMLTDREADMQTDCLIKRAVRAIARNAARRTLIDRTDFEPELRAAAETRDRIATHVAQASVGALRKQKALERAREEAKKLT